MLSGGDAGAVDEVTGGHAQRCLAEEMLVQWTSRRLAQGPLAGGRGAACCGSCGGWMRRCLVEEMLTCGCLEERMPRQRFGKGECRGGAAVALRGGGERRLARMLTRGEASSI